MIVYFGGSLSDFRLAKACGWSCFCLTFYDFWKSRKAVDLSCLSGAHVMLDSGAFSFLSRGYQKREKTSAGQVDKYLQSYVDFVTAY